MPIWPGLSPGLPAAVVHRPHRRPGRPDALGGLDGARRRLGVPRVVGAGLDQVDGRAGRLSRCRSRHPPKLAHPSPPIMLNSSGVTMLVGAGKGRRGGRGLWHPDAVSRMHVPSDLTWQDVDPARHPFDPPQAREFVRWCGPARIGARAAIPAAAVGGRRLRGAQRVDGAEPGLVRRDDAGARRALRALGRRVALGPGRGRRGRRPGRRLVLPARQHHHRRGHPRSASRSPGGPARSGSQTTRMTRTTRTTGRAPRTPPGPDATAPPRTSPSSTR